MQLRTFAIWTAFINLDVVDIRVHLIHSRKYEYDIPSLSNNREVTERGDNEPYSNLSLG